MILYRIYVYAYRICMHIYVDYLVEIGIYREVFYIHTYTYIKTMHSRNYHTLGGISRLLEMIGFFAISRAILYTYIYIHQNYV